VRPGSLERRLQLGLASALLLLFGLLLWGGSAALRQLAEDQVLSRLEHDAEALLGAVHEARGRALHFRGGRLSPIYFQPLSGHYFLVRDENGELLRSRSLWDETLAVPALAPGESRQLTLAGPGVQRLLVHAAGFRKLDRNLTLAVAEDVAGIDAQVTRDRLLFGGGLLAALVLLLIGQRALIRHAFRPLDRVRADLARVKEGASQRVGTELPEEIRPLAMEVNNLLELLDRRLERSRNALGNLAHALKTPLSIVLQTLDDASALEQTERREEARRQAERIRELVDRELRVARTAGVGHGGRKFDPARDVPDLIGTLQSLHRGRDLRFETRLPAEALPAFDREDLVELLGNLLDNACKWAAGRVRLTLRGGSGLVIVVEDDGPGVSDGDLAILTRRGGRLDEAQEGSGLGLAIARDIATTYGGALEFDRSPELGGLRARAALPAAGGEAQ